MHEPPMEEFGFDLPETEWLARVRKATAPEPGPSDTGNDPGDVTQTYPRREGASHVARSESSSTQDSTADGPPAAFRPQDRIDELPHVTEIGPYRILRVIGHGGMGIVYEAQQPRPKRTVALKVMRSGYAGASAWRRFELETQVLGRLQHPGIAQIYEAGIADSADGRQPYFAMELVHGTTIREHMNSASLGTRERLVLIAAVCDAVHYAHQKGVIHRDLKPGNILVDHAGQPKVLDFGVARATDCDLQVTTIQTDVGQLIGTLQYMSPEQVSADPNELDTRSDVFALGVIMFELLAGQRPYELKGMMIHEAARTIREDEPIRLSSINRAFRGDIETIAAKALEKDKGERYQSAAELAADIRRFLNNEPILACPPSALYQIRKFAKRNKAVVGGVVAVMLVLIIGLIGTSWGMFRARRAERIALQETATAERVSDFLAGFVEGIDPTRMAGVLRGDLVRRPDQPQQQPNQSDGSGHDGSSAMQLDRINLVDVAQDLMQSEILERAEARIGAKLQDEPEVAGRLSLTIGNAYFQLNLPEDAERNLLRARKLLTQSRGLTDERTLLALNLLGSVYRKSGRYNKAVTVYRELLAIEQRIDGTPELSILNTMNWLADAYRYQGQIQKADELLRKALPRLRRIAGDTNVATLAAMNNYALVLRDQNRLKESEQLLREASAGFAAKFGEDHSECINARINLGDVLMRQGRMGEAEREYRRALEAARRTLGDDHFVTLEAIDQLARLLLRKGAYAEVEPLIREVIDVRRRVLGPSHPDTLLATSALVQIYDHLGKPEAARPYAVALLKHWREAVDRADASASDFNSYSWDLLTIVPQDLRDATTALAMAQQAVQKSGARDPLVLDTLGLAQEQVGDLDGAVATQTKAVELLPSGPSTPRTDLEERLGQYLLEQKRYGRAEPLLLASYERLEAASNSKSRRAQEAARRLVELYTAWDRAEPGHGYGEKTAEWQAKLSGKESKRDD